MNRGFTMIEVILVIGLLMVLAGFWALSSSGFYQRNILEAEKDNIVSLLRRSRARAMSNVNETSHGIKISTSTYVIFEGSSFAARNQSSDENFPRPAGLVFGGLTEAVFGSPDGRIASTGTISISNDIKTYSIILNAEGAIDWQ